ncbi:hypothetical protein RSOLAG1IB_06463 [Rhizoctonia solani AG-1 IB]|uniref:Uncharacterized protein n=1 Tax=Thanatephorus cucumeris (strain AG1-IB / isolate 7/3/14) TaxID=1108050 RepID=A0A0B7FBQ8_THACB|nr:hypothetical protein RSOLAG1IB_06463 [Rhizoctonia solani AG-1 IB]
MKGIIQLGRQHGEDGSSRERVSDPGMDTGTPRREGRLAGVCYRLACRLSISCDSTQAPSHTAHLCGET